MNPIEEKEEQFNEIVFNNRNKEYGAYALRASYKKRMIIAMFISLTAFLLAVSFPLIAGYLNKTNTIDLDKTVDIELYNKTIKPDVVIPPPPPPPPIDNKEKFKPNGEITVVEENTTDELPDPDKVVNKPIPTIEETIGEIIEKPKEKEIIDDISKVPISVEEMPNYQGGDDGWRKIIINNIQYPIMAKESNISGTVYLKFIVEPDGSITNITLLRGIGGGCDEEAIRVVKMLKNWIPGKQNGNPVRVWLTLPIKFTLQ